ncbi:MAG: TadE/TadG family type IV pilus assembly protein [Sphingomonadaceae bacterium]
MSMLIKSYITRETGSAAVEMALVLPILLTLMFGSFELGNYFLDNHMVTKAVRDGARYASRGLPLKESCAATIADTTAVIANTQNITTYGALGTGTARLPDWDTDNVFVTFSCSTTGNPAGIYSHMTDGAPVVTVTATIQYRSLFGEMTGVRGFSTSGLNITAQSQIPVMGL